MKLPRLSGAQCACVGVMCVPVCPYVCVRMCVCVSGCVCLGLDNISQNPEAICLEKFHFSIENGQKP